jgi:hypothetical protein
VANFMGQPPRGADPQQLASALMQMSEQPGDQIGVKPAQWDPSGYVQALRGNSTPTAVGGKSTGQRVAGGAMGGLSGAAAGVTAASALSAAGMGAAAGSVVPGIGTMIGGIVGALAGVASGAM